MRSEEARKQVKQVVFSQAFGPVCQSVEAQRAFVADLNYLYLNKDIFVCQVDQFFNEILTLSVAAAVYRQG